MSLEQDHKTKYFLDKIDLLIGKGVIKNHAEVVQALNWNKSVMSSVKNGNLPVPQHIYNKFREVYGEYLNEKPSPGGEGLKDDLIAALKRNNELLEQRTKDIDLVLASLSKMRQDHNNLFALLIAYQERWLSQQVSNPKKFAEALRTIHESALADQERLLKQGISSGNGDTKES